MVEIAIGLIYAFLVGMILGSFANVLVIRIKDRSTMWGRSRCVNCGQAIKPHHLVPILSYLVLKGKCAGCHRPIHFQYPLVELAGGLLVMSAYLRHPFFIASGQIEPFIFESLLLIVLLVLAVFDLRWKLLPIEFIGASTVIFGLWNLLAGRQSILSILIGLAVGVAFLGLQVLFSHGRWMGSGDPWMGGLMGVVLGWPGVAVGFYFTYILGGLVAFFLLITGRAQRSTRIAFGPLLAIGTLLTIWFGPWFMTLVARLWYGA